MNQAKRNYIIDAVIGLGFVITAISSLVFLIPLNWIDFSSSATPTVLGLNFGIWQLLHKWGGIVMLVGVVVHLALHQKWIVGMTVKMLPKPKARRKKQADATQVKTA